ncbi:hypothetical protein [Bradyrhizobium sp. USDA 10063]
MTNALWRAPGRAALPLSRPKLRRHGRERAAIEEHVISSNEQRPFTEKTHRHNRPISAETIPDFKTIDASSRDRSGQRRFSNASRELPFTA